MGDLVARPTPEQLARFRALTPSERYAWLSDVLRTTHGLATDATRASWRERKLAQGGGFVANVATLVGALDRADFVAVAGALSADAMYQADGATLAGAEAIAAAYRSAHERGVTLLDRVARRSTLEPLMPGTVRVVFELRIEHGGRAHRYRYEQEMTVGRSKRVERIVRRELEGERASLDAFLAEVGRAVGLDLL